MPDDLTDYLKHIFVAVPFIFAFLMLLGWLDISGWEVVFAFAVSYLVCDFGMNFLIHGDKGWVKIGANNQSAARGHAFMVFFAAIVVTSALSDWIGNNFLSITNLDTNFIQTLIILNALVVAGALGDYYWRFVD